MGVCGRGSSPAGIRDAALIAVLYGAGLRRSESVGLDVSDYNIETGELAIRGAKGRKDRLGYATNGSADTLKDWLIARGSDSLRPFGFYPGLAPPLFARQAPLVGRLRFEEGRKPVICGRKVRGLLELEPLKYNLILVVLGPLRDDERNSAAPCLPAGVVWINAAGA